jgi:hypothetical protein
MAKCGNSKLTRTKRKPFLGTVPCFSIFTMHPATSHFLHHLSNNIESISPSLAALHASRVRKQVPSIPADPGRCSRCGSSSFTAAETTALRSLDCETSRSSAPILVTTCGACHSMTTTNRRPSTKPSPSQNEKTIHATLGQSGPDEQKAFVVPAEFSSSQPSRSVLPSTPITIPDVKSSKNVANKKKQSHLQRLLAENREKTQKQLSSTSLGLDDFLSEL